MSGDDYREWVAWVRERAADAGLRCSNRQARAVTPSVLLALAAENEPPPLHHDPTGEEAVRRVLVQQLAA